MVYGHPAVAIAVDRHTEVRLQRRDDGAPTTVLRAPCAIDARLLRAVCSVVDPTGIDVMIDADVPIGRGMGSSASLAVALVRAWADICGEPAPFERCHEAGFAVERVFHGTPSGVDHAVIARGGAVAYTKRAQGPAITPIACPADLPMVVLDSGTAGNTAQLVAGVRQRRPAVDPVLSQMGQLTRRFSSALTRCDALAVLGRLMTENHDLLRQLGVSTPVLDALVELALSAGATGAKLAGAGGGGVVIALTRQQDALIQAAQDAGFQAFAVQPVPPTDTEVPDAP